MDCSNLASTVRQWSQYVRAVPAAQVKDNAALQVRSRLANFHSSGRNLLVAGPDQPEISSFELIECSEWRTRPKALNSFAGTVQAAITNPTNVNRSGLPPEPGQAAGSPAATDDIDASHCAIWK